MIFSGVTISLRLKRRSEFLGEILLLISQIGVEIEFAGMPVLEILKKIQRGCCCKSLDFIALCLESTQSGEDFFCSWKTGVDASCLPMKKEEREKLKNLGAMLGTSDATGQRAMLTLYKSYFSAFYDRALREHEKYARMCVTLSAVAGAGIFILII